MSETIEDIILQQDKRGMSALRPHLPADFCSQAAGYIMDHPGGAIIVTGYYALMSHKPETDGPPGAIAIGNALQALGRRVTYVTDLHTAPVLRDWLGPEAEVEEFPIADVPTSQQVASETLARLKPGLLISIERSSRTKDDIYTNMRDIDISPYTARVDYLFEAGVPSVGIGDGGNEIGMGNLVEIIPTVDSLPNSPAVTKVDRLVITSVSNWGGYGLVAALSRLAGKNLLPTVDHETRLIKRMVEIGVVDGTTGEAIPTVDNFSLEVNSEVLEQLHRAVAEGA
ncbi:MAG: DUF4392 domain-containing protein [Dehalococcoidia bacterium]|jgi:hypothetical protein|nr:DUF4392 domain-containing protein [Dehalococcoidia bacterium]MDP6228950.1 DUF4392 domain-containing protein [Dehalococcoidia bacterium]MDP7083666.1 DUF4392 domain-containing protein [Dehalococcoidia bacterium]MDP7199516.1 DUF4392 domain-containing protein [Dehalococcoidia bacterium]MDP7510963.1 DUF4392 domain-containing protein [Dehalococcoidia bacterium]